VWWRLLCHAPEAQWGVRVEVIRGLIRESASRQLRRYKQGAGRQSVLVTLCVPEPLTRAELEAGGWKRSVILLRWAAVLNCSSSQFALCSVWFIVSSGLGLSSSKVRRSQFAVWFAGLFTGASPAPPPKGPREALFLHGAGGLDAVGDAFLLEELVDLGGHDAAHLERVYARLHHL